MTTMAATPVLELGFSNTTGSYLVLDSATQGILDANVLAAGRGFVPVWTDVSNYLQHFDYTRGRQRQTDSFAAASFSASLKNTDGRFSPTNLSGPYVSSGTTQVRPGIAVRLSINYQGIKYVRFYGYVTSWTNSPDRDAPKAMAATFSATDALGVGGIARYDIPTGGASVGGSELSGTRINRLLDAAGWDTFLRDIDAGNSTLQASDLSGNVLQSLQLVADSENGSLYVNELGSVCFRDRYARITRTFSNTSQATFGDGVGENHYSEIVPAYDDSLVINTAQYTRTGGTTQVVDDAASVADNGIISDTKDGLLNQSDAEVNAAAGWVVARFKNPELRIDSITIQPERDPNLLWTQVHARTIDDRITVKHRPAAGDTITQDVFIESIAESWDVKDTWRTTYSLSSAAAFLPFFLLDSSTQGVLNTNALGY